MITLSTTLLFYTNTTGTCTGSRPLTVNTSGHHNKITWTTTLTLHSITSKESIYKGNNGSIYLLSLRFSDWGWRHSIYWQTIECSTHGRQTKKGKEGTEHKIESSKPCYNNLCPELRHVPTLTSRSSKNSTTHWGPSIQVMNPLGTFNMLTLIRYPLV